MSMVAPGRWSERAAELSSSTSDVHGLFMRFHQGFNRAFVEFRA
jgi:hypothetical protein